VTVTFVVERTCLLCGWRDLGLLWASIRPAMRSYRIADGMHLGWGARECDECGGPLARSARGHLDAESTARLEAWRADRREKRRAA